MFAFPQTSYGKPLIPNEIVCGVRTFKEVIVVKWGHGGGGGPNLTELVP